MSSPATALLWFQLRSPELADDFERLMAGDRDVVRGSLDMVLDWRLRRATDVPQDWRTTRATGETGQVSDEADYVLIAEIAAGDASVQQLADDLDHLVVLTSFEIRPRP
jgi:hypothetical protein